MNTNVQSIPCDDGAILLDAIHQGRVFAEMDGRRLHRWDAELAKHPSATEFNNLGGNSLWPAPEGGEYAYNYLGGEWLVQPGVNVAPATCLEMDGRSLGCSRTVPMRNRKGAQMQMTFHRVITPAPDDGAGHFQLRHVGYHSQDSIRFVKPQDPAKAVVAAWSLEQFDSAENVVAFGKCTGQAADSLNLHFYGDARPRLKCHDHWFRFAMGGTQRLQIGVSAKARPIFIGAFIPDKDLLVLRSCHPGHGTRIDIADNDQPRGIYGADDQFSIFNGGPLGFFELETIAPMDLDEQGRVIGSTLLSNTHFYCGSRDNIERILLNVFGAPAGLELLG